MKMYRSTRMARYHRPFRGRDEPPPPTYQIVRGYPADCSCPRRLAVVGEGPGEDEDQAGYPFVGRSGEELDRFLDTYGIDPDQCFITNIGRVFRFGNPDPTSEDIETWEFLLREELNIARPIWIASVGRVSTRFFLGDVDMDSVHGIPYLVRLDWLDNGRDGRVVVIPVVHPAAGFHSPEAQSLTAYDFAQLAATIEGRLTPIVADTHDQYPNPDYQELTDDQLDLRLIQDSLSGGSTIAPMPVAIDTEGLHGNPWGLSYSVEPGRAWVIRKVHRLALKVFYAALVEGIRKGRIHVVLHNSLHDLRVLRELSTPIPDGSFTDTMVLAYHLCIEPQGLKPLAYRHCGMDMSSYDEIVQDAQDRIAVEYYEMMEALCADGIQYISPASEYWTWTSKQAKGLKLEHEADSQEQSFADQIDFHDEHPKAKLSVPKRHVIEPVGPVSVGPFRYIDPYEVTERDKSTGQLRVRTKKPQQLDQRVRRALDELRSGKITAADLRKRWDNTDDLVVDIAEEAIGPMREADLDDVPLDRAIRYAARDADATLRIYPILRERHRAMGLDRVGAIDHNIIPMVDQMQAVGLAVDIPYLKGLSADLARRMLEVQQQIKQQFGVWINPNSGEQVADLLFRPVEEGGYGLIATKKTKGRLDPETGAMVGRRGSTQDKVLEGLRNDHPIVPLILQYRGLLKAKTSFADVAIRRAVQERVPVEWDDDDVPIKWETFYVVHCNFRITRVSSGRLSATGPNLMAVMGGELGNEIRDGYIAGEGYMFSEWDLNQIEMRVMASEANDSFLIDMFIRDEDIHTGTADKMFGLHLQRPYNKKQVDKDKHRDPAKRTGFGIITGIQAPGLVDQMRLQGIIVSEEEAAKWIVDWLAACPSVPVYMEACHREARAYGFVRDWAGRIRYLPGIHSPFRHIRAEAGRQSHSHKIQAGAQSILKVAMHKVHSEVLPYWRERGKYIVPVLQIHDSLMFRHRGFDSQEMAELDAQIRGALFSSAPPGFRVPLDAGSGSATKWGQLEH